MIHCFISSGFQLLPVSHFQLISLFFLPQGDSESCLKSPPSPRRPFCLSPSTIRHLCPTLELSLRCVTRPHFLKNSDILSFFVRIIIRSHFLSAVMGYNIDQPRRESSLASAPNSYHVVWHPSQQTSVSVES